MKLKTHFFLGAFIVIMIKSTCSKNEQKIVFDKEKVT
jgi:hypothetical protein